MRPGRPTKSPVAMASALPAVTTSGLRPSSGPVRIFGPPRSCSTATTRLARCAAARIRSNVAAWLSCVPCEKFSRKMSVPAAMSASIIASLSLAGPTVAMIFV